MRRGLSGIGVLVVIFCVCSAAFFPAVVVAQDEEPPTNETDNETVGNETPPIDGGNETPPTNETDAIGGSPPGNETGPPGISPGANNSTVPGGQIGVGGGLGGGIGGGMGGGFGVPSTEEITEDMLDFIVEWITEHGPLWIVGAYDDTHPIAFGAPVPINDGAFDVFGTPTNEPFASLFGDLLEDFLFPISILSIIISLFLIAGYLPISAFFGGYRVGRWIVLFFAAGFLISGQWPLVTLIQGAVDSIGMWLAPSTEELTSTEDGLETSLLALGTGAVGFYIFGWIKAVIYGIVFGFRWWYLESLAPYVFGLFLALAVFAPMQKIRATAATILWQHIGILLMGPAAALMWRGAYIAGFENGLVAIGFIIGTVVVPIFLCYTMYRTRGIVAGAVVGGAAALRQRRENNNITPKPVQYARSIGGRARSGLGSVRQRVSGRLGADSRRSTQSAASSSANTGGRRAGRAPIGDLQHRPDTTAQTIKSRAKQRQREQQDRIANHTRPNERWQLLSERRSRKQPTTGD